MDKAQKSLIDTYFRKRKISANESYEYNYQPYEINNYTINSNLVDINEKTISGKHFRNMVLDNPKMIPFLAERINFTHIDKGYFAQILEDKPELFEVLGKYLYNYHGFDKYILDMMIDQPILIEKFSDRFDDFNGEMVAQLLIKYSENDDILKKIKNYAYDLKFFWGFEIYNVLITKPNLYPYFSEYFHKIKPPQLTMLMQNHHELIEPLKSELKRLSDMEIFDIIQANPNYEDFIENNR
jgi:hypothetical protein